MQFITSTIKEDKKWHKNKMPYFIILPCVEKGNRRAIEYHGTRENILIPCDISPP
jgi:hypothetical protein